MLGVDRTMPSEVDMDAISVLDEQKNTRPSMLYHMLPTIVSDRIPTLPSLRRSLNDARNRATHSKSNSMTDISQPETPPPGYSSRPGSGCVTPNRFSLAFAEAESDFSDDASERPSSSRSASTPAFGANEIATGINWKYASQGRNLVTQARREASAPIHDIDETSAALTRQLYVHGITYLLRGLPTDLTPEEMLSLQAALPHGLVGLNSSSDEHALVAIGQRAPVVQSTPPQDPTILYRITATIVFQTFVLLQFLLPYVRLFITQAYQFERKHQITKRVVNTGVYTVDEMSRKSLRLSQTVCQMNDGKVGQAINEMTLWWIRGFTGGLQQGIEEGLSAVGRPETSRRRVTVEKGN